MEEKYEIILQRYIDHLDKAGLQQALFMAFTEDGRKMITENAIEYYKAFPIMTSEEVFGLYDGDYN